MTKNAPEPSRIRSSDHQFLFRKTDQKSQSRISPETAPEQMDGLSDAFPDMLAGGTFLEQAMAHVVASDRFGALVIRVDTPEEGDAQTGSATATAVAQAVRDACDSDKGLWGRLEWDLFGCIFPNGDGDRYRQLAETIQKKIADSGNASVTIGIACFPTIDFPQNRILDNARKALEHAAFFGPGSVVSFDAVSLNISGDQYYQEGDIDGAISEFQKALELDPENVNVHNSLGVCYGVREAYPEAAAAFETASRLDPSEPMSLYNQGLVHLMADDGASKALRYFLDAYALGDDIFEVAFQIGKLYLERNEPQKGHAYLERAAQLRPTAAIVQRYLGDSCRARGMTRDAVAAYRKAVKQNPNDAEALCALGSLLEELGENSEVVETFYRHSVAIEPQNGLFRHLLGMYLFKRGDLDQAVAVFREAVALGHDSRADLESAMEQLEAQMGHQHSRNVAGKG